MQPFRYHFETWFQVAQREFELGAPGLKNDLFELGFFHMKIILGVLLIQIILTSLRIGYGVWLHHIWIGEGLNLDNANGIRRSS